MATQAQIDALNDLLRSGKRICPDCQQEINDPDNFRAGFHGIEDNQGRPLLEMRVNHITCPE